MFFNWRRVPVKIPKEGVKMQVVTADNIQFVLFEIEPYTEIPCHSHPHEQMGTVLEGEILLRIEGEERVLHAGEGYVVPSGVPHSAKTLDRKAIVLDVFHPPREEYK